MRSLVVKVQLDVQTGGGDTDEHTFIVPMCQETGRGHHCRLHQVTSNTASELRMGGRIDSVQIQKKHLPRLLSEAAVGAASQDLKSGREDSM